ncbi:MAG: single-stranded-DNA-specific exonuclease RecJ [Gammaproteobacteria bacterium]|nr:single-stranded-DNA-specific exonuclease RecJ [Gammaproteobacteria bacterium]
MIPRILSRSPQIDADLQAQLSQKLSLSPLQIRIVANRAHDNDSELHLSEVISTSLKNIASPTLLIDSVPAVKRIAEAIKNSEIIGLLTDYDVDGITSHAILLHSLRDFFGVPKENIQHLIGHRIDDGYGISQGLVDRILQSDILPDLIITADCGSSDERQIIQLKEKGIDLIVTDHHAIPQEGIPQSAIATINPTRDDCSYPDSTIAGCMVAWLLMSSLRAQLLSTNIIAANSPKLSSLLDFVALGTVADAVSLSSPINRAVVNVGLKVMNQLQRPCWQAIKQLLDRDFQAFTAEDLGFQIGPRINARSRMSDPYMALHYLSTASLPDSSRFLSELDLDNQTRKDTEKDMLDIAFVLAKEQLKTQKWSLIIYSESFHAGVQGIVASRLMEKFGRPVIVLSPTNDINRLTGSARTIPGVHIRDAIEHVANHSSDLVLGFGGHKGAAGLKLNSSGVSEFTTQFDQAVELQLNPDDDLRPVIYTDGELEESELSFQTIAELKYLEPFGREFEVPVFEGDFKVQSIRVIGSEGNHLMIQLATESQSFRAVWFRALEKKNDPFPFVQGQFVRVVYQLKENFFRGNFSIQLHIIYASL